MDFEFIEDEGLRAKAKEAFETQMQKTNEKFKLQMDEEVSGLKTKVDELLGEKKTIQEQLAKFGDITDPEKAAEALKFLQENEDAQLIKDGKIEAIIQPRKRRFHRSP
jgi:hypothetical protein